MSRYILALALAQEASRARTRLFPLPLKAMLERAERGVAEGWLTEAELHAIAHRELMLALDGRADHALWTSAGKPEAHLEGEAYFERRAANEHRLRMELARLNLIKAQHRLGEEQGRIAAVDHAPQGVDVVLQGERSVAQDLEPGGADLSEGIASVDGQGEPERHGGVGAHADFDKSALAAGPDEGRSDPVENPDDRRPEVREPVREGPVSYLKNHSNCSPLSLDARREARAVAGVSSPPVGGVAPQRESRP